MENRGAVRKLYKGTDLMKLFFLLALLVCAAAAHIVPDVYIVELTSTPAIAFASKDARRTIPSDRIARIRAEQTTARRMVEARQGSVVTGIDTVANALIVQIPDSAAPGLSAIPGVTRVYPVMEMH